MIEAALFLLQSAGALEDLQLVEKLACGYEYSTLSIDETSEEILGVAGDVVLIDVFKKGDARWVLDYGAKRTKDSLYASSNREHFVKIDSGPEDIAAVFIGGKASQGSARNFIFARTVLADLTGSEGSKLSHMSLRSSGRCTPIE